MDSPLSCARRGALSFPGFRRIVSGRACQILSPPRKNRRQPPAHRADRPLAFGPLAVRARRRNRPLKAPVRMLKFAVPLAQPFQFAHDAGPRAPRRYPPTGRRAPSAPAPGPRPARTTSTADLVMAAPGRLPVATRPDPARQAPAAPIVQSCASSGRLGRINGVKAIVQRFPGRAVAVRFRRIDATCKHPLIMARTSESFGAPVAARIRLSTFRTPLMALPCVGRLAIVRAIVSGARVRSCQARRQTGAPGAAAAMQPGTRHGRLPRRALPRRALPGAAGAARSWRNPADDAPLAPPRAPGRQPAGRLPARCQGVQPESRAPPEGPRRPAQPVGPVDSSVMNGGPATTVRDPQVDRLRRVG